MVWDVRDKGYIRRRMKRGLIFMQLANENYLILGEIGHELRSFEEFRSSHLTSGYVRSPPSFPLPSFPLPSFPLPSFPLPSFLLSTHSYFSDTQQFIWTFLLLIRINTQLWSNTLTAKDMLSLSLCNSSIISLL